MIYVCMQGWSDDKPVKTKQIYPDLEAGKEHIEKTLSNFPSANKEPMGAFLRVFSNDHKTDFTLTILKAAI